MDRNTSGFINRPQPRMDPITFNREWILRRELRPLGGEIMPLLSLWCEAQAAQERLRNPFRESSKPNQELMINWPINVGTPGPNRLPIGHKSIQEVLNGDRSIVNRQFVPNN